jgi:protein-L-isoaspartate(D-aspartate) O-methyltransferase
MLVKIDSFFIGVYFFMAIGLILNAQQANENDPYEEQRQTLIEKVLKPGGIKSKAVLDAIENTPRHEFVPEDLLDQAYLDRALPIGEKQTISSPYIVAVMTEVLQPTKADKVLEIGTGSGYQAAVLSPLVKSVYTIEIVEELGKATAKLLDRLDYDNVYTKIGDGFQGWKENAPFDKIM